MVSARASVMVYSDADKKWLPSGSSHGISKVSIYHHPGNSTFRIVGRKLQDMEVSGDWTGEVEQLTDESSSAHCTSGQVLLLKTIESWHIVHLFMNFIFPFPVNILVVVHGP